MYLASLLWAKFHKWIMIGAAILSAIAVVFLKGYSAGKDHVRAKNAKAREKHVKVVAKLQRKYGKIAVNQPDPDEWLDKDAKDEGGGMRGEGWGGFVILPIIAVLAGCSSGAWDGRQVGEDLPPVPTYTPAQINQMKAELRACGDACKMTKKVIMDCKTTREQLRAAQKMAGG